MKKYSEEEVKEIKEKAFNNGFEKGKQHVWILILKNFRKLKKTYYNS